MNTNLRRTILHVIHSLEGGGTEQVLLALLQSMDPIRFGQMVVTLRVAGSLAAHLPDHVACRALDIRRTSHTAGLAIGAVVRRRGATLIHARNTGCWADAVVAKLCAPRSRLVLSFHGLESDRPFDLKIRQVIRVGLWANARFTTVSHSGKRQLAADGKVPEKRIHVLFNGVDIRRFRPPDPSLRRRVRDALGIPHDCFVLGSVGSLTPVKDHRMLMQALGRLAAPFPQLRLLIVGDGPLRQALERQAFREGVAPRVTLTGRREDIPEMLGAMDAYACSSRSEGMNNSLLEAMACGLPVVATDVGDNARLVCGRIGPTVPDPAGTVVPANTPSQFADAVAGLLNHPGVAPRFAAAARHRAANFDEGSMLAGYEAFYENVLSGDAKVGGAVQV